jgi:site-specific recombinase XerD
MAVELKIPAVLDAWLRQSVLAVGVEPFVANMESCRYASSTIRRYVGAVAHIARWMSQERVTLNLFDERLVERFVDEHLPRCDCPKEATRWISNLRAAGRRFLAVSRQAGLIAAPVSAGPLALTAELEAFDAYLERARGLASATRGKRRWVAADFLQWRFGSDSPDPARLSVSDIHAFVIERLGATSAGRSAATITSALRSYLRYCALSGPSVDALLAAVPSVAQWRQEALPQVLSESLLDDVERTFDRSTAGGLRDRAMFRLMLDLGLRVSEVVGIRLEDIDWRAGILRVKSSKVRRVDSLPLSQDVADIIIEYLRNARPQTAQRALFVRKTAPVDEPISLNAVRAAMRQAYARCGHSELKAKTHVLRHTAASRMLRAGTPLKHIADVLRHRSLDTTTIYAKVDSVRLAAVAMPWPETQSWAP